MGAVAECFADRAAAVLPQWIAKRATAVLHAAGLPASAVTAAADAVHREGLAAGHRAADALRALVGTDIDRQRTTPLAVVRASVGGVTDVLHQVGVTAPARPEAVVRAAPEDRFGLAPSSWSEVDADLAEAALTWGAAKAAVHLRRHRPRARGDEIPASVRSAHLGSPGNAGAARTAGDTEGADRTD